MAARSSPSTPAAAQVEGLHFRAHGVGTMVVLKEEYLPPLQWKLGRIARVLSIRTADGVVKRPTARVCILSVDEGGGSTEH